MNKDLHDDGIFTVVLIICINTPAVIIMAVYVLSTSHVSCLICLGKWEKRSGCLLSTLWAYHRFIEQCAARETLCRPTVWDDVRELILSSKLERNTHIATPAHIMHGSVIQTLSVCLPWEPAALSALSLPLCQPSGLRVWLIPSPATDTNTEHLMSKWHTVIPSQAQSSD